MTDALEPSFSDAVMAGDVVPAGLGGFCNGRLKQKRADGRTTCTQKPGWDTPHPGVGRCSRHGGSTPSHVESAKHEQARELLGTLGVVADPSSLPRVVVLAELQLSAAKHLAAVRWLERQVAEIPTADVPSSPWPRLLSEQRRECDRLLVELARLGIDLAHVQLGREQVAVARRLVESAIAGLDELVFAATGRHVLDPHDPAVREVVYRAFDAIEGSAA